MALGIIGTDIILLCIECETLEAMGMYFVNYALGRIIYNFRYEIPKRCISRFGFCSIGVQRGFITCIIKMYIRSVTERNLL